ncbi:MAG TPA: chorismate-binding protein, partial [Vulgatibacter sp.]
LGEGGVCGLSLLGWAPASRMEVRDGATGVDGRAVGDPLEILRRLETGLGEGLFPAWIGFFTYEFARHLGLPAREPLAGIPEAVFHLYPQGIATRGGVVLAGSSRPDFAPTPLPPGALPPVEPTDELGAEGHHLRVREIQGRIRAGQVYQVNLSQRFRFPAAGVDPARLYERLRALNPSPYMGLLEGEGWALVSGSPERLFSLSAPEGDGARIVRARPIAGTRPRGRTDLADEALERELLASSKERAEHAMIVDLLRNDLARCCEPGTVELPEIFTVERYSHVMHLVSEVLGRTRASFADVFSASFPGGSITGAPKGSVMGALAELEPVARGPYTGSLGYVSGAGADLNIVIRSFAFAGGASRRDGEPDAHARSIAVAEEAPRQTRAQPGAHGFASATGASRREQAEAGVGDRFAFTSGDVFFSAGGGVVIDSEPGAERSEALAKAQALVQALRGGAAGASPEPPRKTGSWRPPVLARRPEGARVLFVENHDSFSYNVIDYLRSLGAQVEVMEGEAAPTLAGATHLVVGP